MGSWDFLNEPMGSGFATDPYSGSNYFDSLSTPDYLKPKIAPSRGLFGDIASNLGRGGVHALGLLGHSLDQFNIETGIEEWAASADERYMFMRPDLEEARGQEGWFKRSAMSALQSAPASLVPLGAAAVGTVAGGPVGTAAGFGAGLASLVGLFGAGTYNQTFREHKDTIGEEKAHALALETALWEVGTEGLSDAAAVLTGGLLGAPVKGIMGGLKAGVKPTLQSVMQAGPKNFLRAAGVNVGAEVGSEALNAFMQTKAEIKAGLDPSMTPEQAALASIGPSLFLSGGITLGTQGMGAVNRNKIVGILKSEETSQRDKFRAAQIIENQLKKEKPEWAANWKEVSDHIINNGGTFDIQEDFVNKAASMIVDKEAVALNAQAAPAVRENKELDDILNNPEGIIEEALVGQRRAQGLNVLDQATPDEQVEALIQEITPQLREALARKEEAVQRRAAREAGEQETAAPESTPFEQSLRSLLRLDPQERAQRTAAAIRIKERGSREGIPGYDEFVEGVNTAVHGRRQVEKLDLQPSEEANRLFDEEFQRGWAEKAHTDKTSRSLSGYFRDMIRNPPQELNKAQAARKARETQEKLTRLGVPPEVELSPEIYKAVEETSLAAIEEDGFYAVELNLPQTEQIPSEKETTPAPKRTLTPKERAQLVQAVEEYSEISGEFEEGGEKLGQSVEEQLVLRELEAEIRKLSGKTDEDLDTIYPGLKDLAGIEEYVPKVSSEVETAVQEQIAAINAEVDAGTKTEREARQETTLLNGLTTDDTAAIEAALSQYKTTSQKNAVVEAARKIKTALDAVPQDDPSTQALKRKIYLTLNYFATKPVKNKLPDGLLQWEEVPQRGKGAGELYTAVSPDDPNVKYFLEPIRTKRGERRGKYQIYTTEIAPQAVTGGLDINVVEKVVIEGNSGESAAALVRRFYKEGGGAGFISKPIKKYKKGTPAKDKTGEYTSSSDTRNYFISESGSWVAVPRSKGGDWGVLRTATFEQWYDLTRGEQNKSWYATEDGKTILAKNDALDLIRREEGKEDLEIAEDLLVAESPFLDKYKEEEAQVGLEQGSKGPTDRKGRAPRAKGTADKFAAELEADNPPGEVTVRRGTKELKSGKKKEIKGEKYVTAELKSRIESSQARSAGELSRILEEIASKYSNAFERGNLREMASLKKDAYEAVGYRNIRRAPKDISVKIDRYLNAAMASVYQTKKAEQQAIQKEIDSLQQYKKDQMYEMKRSKADDTTPFHNRVRKANRNLVDLKKRQGTLTRSLRATVTRAAKHGGVSEKVAENVMANFSMRGLTEAFPAPKIEIAEGGTKRPEGVEVYEPIAKVEPRIPEETRAADQTEQLSKPADIPAMADTEPAGLTLSKRPAAKKPPEVIRSKGLYTIRVSDTGAVVVTPDGTTSVELADKAAAEKFINERIAFTKKYKAISSAPAKEMQHKGGNGWSIQVQTDRHFPDEPGIQTPGVLESENGKYTATYTALRKDFQSNPFLPSHAWLVKDIKSKKIIARFQSAEDLTAAINGATTTGYIPKRAKGVGRQLLTQEEFDAETYDRNIALRTEADVSDRARRERVATQKEPYVDFTAPGAAVYTGEKRNPKKKDSRYYSSGEEIGEVSGNTAGAVADRLSAFLGNTGTQRWAGHITVVQTQEEAASAGTELRARGVEGAVFGYYDPQTNSITLIADNIVEGQEQGVFLHEGVHFVMKNDPDYVRNKDAILSRISVLKDKAGAVQDAWNEAAEKNPNATEDVLAEEAYGYLMQNPENRQVGLVRQALAAIKRFLIKMRIPVGALKLTDGDLVAMATKSIKNIKETKPQTAGDIRFSVASATTAEPGAEPIRSQTGEQLSTKSIIPDDGGRRQIFAPITDATPKNADKVPRSNYVIFNARSGKYYEYADFNTQTQEYDVAREITKAEYNTIADRYTGEKQQADEQWYYGQGGDKTAKQFVKEGAKSFLKKTAKTAKSMTQSISEGVRNISPKAYAKLNRMEFEIQDKVKDYGKRAVPFLKKYDALSGKDKFLLDQALRNGDTRTRNRILAANNMTDTWEGVQGVLDEINRGALETGLITDDQLLRDYFPRHIKTGEVDNLVASMRKEDSAFNTVLGDEMDKLSKHILRTEGRDMTEADRLAHIQKMLNTGHYQFIPKPGASKDRGITSVKNEQAQFYDNSAGALEGHIYDMVQATEYRRLLGKNNLSRPRQMKMLKDLVSQIDELQSKENRSEKENEKLAQLHDYYESKAAELDGIESDLKGSIAAYVEEELGKGNERATELIHLIRSRLTQRGTHGTWGTVRDFGYMFTLGSPMSAITQLGDLALSAYANMGKLGQFNTTAAIFNQIVARFTKSERMTKDYFDFSHSLGDFNKTGVENKSSQTALDWVLRKSGLKAMDLFGKDVFLTAAMNKNSKMPKAQFIKEKGYLFGGDTKRAGNAWEDIKNRKFDNENRDALFVLFNDLSQWQPISLSEMPPMYNTAGNGRIFYMLKSFNIKALNSLYRESIGVMLDKTASASDKTKAAARGVGLVLAISMAGAGADEIKDFLLGRETDFGDNVYDNLLSMLLLNRFTLEKGIQQGQMLTSLVNGQLPPVRFADYMIDDMAKFAFDRENFKFKSLNNIPVVGRWGYSWTEAGRSSELANRKRDLYDEIKMNAQGNHPLYYGFVRERLKKYNDLATQLGEDKLGYKQLKNVRSKEKKKLREDS